MTVRWPCSVFAMIANNVGITSVKLLDLSCQLSEDLMHSSEPTPYYAPFNCHFPPNKVVGTTNIDLFENCEMINDVVTLETFKYPFRNETAIETSVAQRFFVTLEIMKKQWS